MEKPNKFIKTLTDIKDVMFLTKNKLVHMCSDLIKENDKLSDQYQDLLEENGYVYYEIDKLDNENKLLKDKIAELEGITFNTTQENAALTDKVEELKSDLEVYERIGDNEDTESDRYMETMMVNALDNTTKERNIYKETINKICDKFGIDHSEVFKIIDNIQDKSTEREI